MPRSTLAAWAIAAGTSLLAVPDAQAQALVPCAPEQGFCRVPYPTEVIYGVPGRSTALFVRGPGILCSNRVFGDPAPGIPKRCAYVARGYGRDGDRDRYRGGYGRWRDREDFAAWRTCARENGFCDFEGRARVRYGARGHFVEGTFRNGVECSNEVFGDPAPGVRKICQVLL